MKIGNDALLDKLKASWASFTEAANELSSRGFLVSVESGWEVVDAPIDNEITQVIVEPPKPSTDD